MTDFLNDMFNSYKNELGKNIGEIRLYSSIGEGWGEDGAVAFNDKLDEYRECDEIHVRINSTGGSVFSGNAIYSSLKRFPKQVTVYVDGIAASIASVIMCAGDKVICPANSIVMIHRPWTQNSGNATDMRETADILDKLQETVMEAYLSKSKMKMTKAQLNELIVGEYGDGTWLSAREAMDFGLVDEIEHECLIAASYDGPSTIIMNGVNMDLSNFKNTDRLNDIIKSSDTKDEKDIVNKKIEETVEIMATEEKQSMLAKIDSIVNTIKLQLGLVEDSKEVTAEETKQDVETITSEEVELEVEDKVSAESDTKVKNEAEETEGNEQPEVKNEAETADEKEKTQQEEPEIKIAEETEEKTEETEKEIEQSEEAEKVEDSEKQEEVKDEIEKEIKAEVSTSKALADLQDKVKQLEVEKLEAAVKLAKAELAKTIEAEYAGVPGKVEDKVELIYEVKNSNVSKDTKNFILNSLKSLSTQNLKDCKELGHNKVVELDEKAEQNKKIKEAVEKYDLTEGQALLYVGGKKTLAQAKKSSEIVRNKKKVK